MLASRYTDNVPPHYTTSIDGNLHRRGATQPHGRRNILDAAIFGIRFRNGQRRERPLCACCDCFHSAKLTFSPARV